MCYPSLNPIPPGGGGWGCVTQALTLFRLGGWGCVTQALNPIPPEDGVGVCYSSLQTLTPFQIRKSKLQTNEHNSTTHVQHSCKGSGSSGQQFRSCLSSSALHSQTLNKTQGLSSRTRYFQGGPTIVGLFKPQSPHYKCETFAAMLA